MKLYQDVLHDHVVAFGSESVADWELFKKIFVKFPEEKSTICSSTIQKKKSRATPFCFDNHLFEYAKSLKDVKSSCDFKLEINHNLLLTVSPFIWVTNCKLIVYIPHVVSV